MSFLAEVMSHCTRGEMRFQEYLAAKGAIKTLTKKEADIFGIPYPPANGWPSRYSNVTVTPEMVDKLRAAFGRNSSASGLRVQRGIAAASGGELPVPEKLARQDDSEIETLRRVRDAARTLLEYSGDDVARILAALNVLRAEVESVSSVPVTLQACCKHASGDAPSIAASMRKLDSSEGPPWDV